MTDEDIIKSLTKIQKDNLIYLYEYYQKTGIKHEDRKKQLGTNARTGNTLYKKGLVNLSHYQLTDWTMWEITETGIRISELIIQ